MAKNSTASLDTNALLRLLLDDVPEQTKRVEELLEDGNVFQIADAALLEVAFVLEKVYEMPRSHVAENIFALIRNEQFNCNQKAFERALPTYRDNKKVPIVDCLLVAYADLNQATPLYTFDKELRKAYPDNTASLL